VATIVHVGIPAVVAVGVGIVFWIENLAYYRHLDQLPDPALVRVASLQTENGFYYSYYSEMLAAKTVREGLRDIIWDRRSEFPDVLNAIRRFNIYQEVLLALAYRALRFLGLAVVDSWQFFKCTVLGLNALGSAALALLATAVSGNPLAGLLHFLFSFLNRFEISRLGNYTSLNLREQWAIPFLWIQTLCCWHLLAGTVERMPRVVRLFWAIFVFTTFLFIVLWQFSPFMLLLQATSVYFVYLVCGYRGRRDVVVGIIDTYLVTLFLAIVVQFGDPYLITSPFMCQALALKVSTSLCTRRCASDEPPVRGIGRVCLTWFRRRAVDVGEGSIAVVAFLLLMKAVQPFATADDHVYEILCTKFSTMNDWLPGSIRLRADRLPECVEPSFNARLYLIMGVFNVIEATSLETYKETLAGPLALLSCALVLLRFVLGTCPSRPLTRTLRDASRAVAEEPTNTLPEMGKEGVRRRRTDDAKAKKKDVPSAPKVVPGGCQVTENEERADRDDAISGICEESAQLFFVMQSLLFFFLGAMVNRLRVAFGPPMMVLAASCIGPRVFPFRPVLRRFPVIVNVVLSVLAGWLFISLWGKMPCVGAGKGACSLVSPKETSDGDTADLMDWMNKYLSPSKSVLCSMNLAGSVRAFTAAPLIVHPQFESVNLRKRVQLAYELYHCGSEESLVKTMTALHAHTIIFEQHRCFFTPYTLDDKRKNCNPKRHKDEDLLCLKLHAQSRFFRLLFINGGYSMFELRQTPLPATKNVQKKPPSMVARQLEDPETWRTYVEECAQQEDCAGRLGEAAFTWEHKHKRERVANIMRNLMSETFPQDGIGAYYMGRYLDYDAKTPAAAGAWYKKAVTRLPNNPYILREYLLWLELEARDSAAISELLQRRMKRRGSELSLLKMKGQGITELWCEAAVSAKQLAMADFSERLWAKALKFGGLSKCIKTNWEMMYTVGDKYDDVYTQWYQLKQLWAGGVTHTMGSHNAPCVRFVGDRDPLRLEPYPT